MSGVSCLMVIRVMLLYFQGLLAACPKGLRLGWPKDCIISWWLVYQKHLKNMKGLTSLKELDWAPVSVVPTLTRLGALDVPLPLGAPVNWGLSELAKPVPLFNTILIQYTNSKSEQEYSKDTYTGTRKLPVLPNVSIPSLNDNMSMIYLYLFVILTLCLQEES